MIAGGGTNLTIENLTIRNIYVHTSASDSTIGDSSANCVYNNGVATGWTIENNVMHDMSWCINIQYNSSSNITISGNNIYNIDHGIALGGPNAGYTLSNVNISGNNIHDYSNWDTTLNSYHHDGVHVWGYMDNGSDTIFNLNIYNNTFGGCIGQNVTAHVFIEANAGGSDAVNIYNNTFIDTCSGADNDGMLTTGVDGGHNIYNNTFIGASTDVCVGTSSSPSITFINNVVSGCGTLMYIATGGGFAASGLHNNIYANCSGGNCWNWKGSTTGTFSTWQSDTGQDASPSAYTASAGLNASGVPQSGSAVISQGANLTSLGITALNSDILSVARPSSGAWDDGAYKFVQNSNCSNTSVGGGMACAASEGNQTTGLAGTSVTFSSGYAAGSVIVVNAGAWPYTSSKPWTSAMIHNTAGYTWTFWGNCEGFSSPNYVEEGLYYTTVPTTTNASDTISVSDNATGGTSTLITAVVYTGIGAIDGTGVCASGTTAAPSTGSYMVTYGDLTVGVVASRNAISQSIAGWNNRADITNLTTTPQYNYAKAADQRALTGTANANFSLHQSPGVYWATIGVAFLPLINPGPQPPPPPIDSYGGYQYFPCINPSNVWKTVILFKHELQCDPLGHVWFGKTIDAVAPTLCSADQFGHDCNYYSNLKYGNSATWANVTSAQMVSWGMSGLYNYAADVIQPNSSVNTNLPFVMIARPCLYDFWAGVNYYPGAGLTSPIKNVYNGVSPVYTANSGFKPSRGVCDFEDPGYDAGLTWVLNAPGVAFQTVITSPYHLYLQGISGEETDQTFGYNGGYDFATTPLSKNQPLISMILATGSPVQTANGTFGFAGYGVTYAIYPDHFVHQKLTWMNGLIAKYTTIAALNTAWGTSGYYTTFGTSGKCWGASGHYTGMTCATSGAAATTSGSGSGPYTATLSTTVSKYSVAVYDDSTLICGDDGAGNLVSASGTPLGAIEVCATGRVNYATGAVSATLNQTPGATPTVEYIQNGWCVSGATGIMDECANYAASQGWWGTCSTFNWPGTSCNFATYAGMNATLVTDLRNFEHQTTYNWLSGERTIIKAAAPWVEFIGAAQGSWGTVPDCQISQAMGQTSDIYTTVDPNPTQAMLDFVQSCAGDVAIETGQYTTANPDSELGFQNVSATHSGTTVTLTPYPGDFFYIGPGQVTISNCTDPTYNTASDVSISGTLTSATVTISPAPLSISTTGCLVAYDPAIANPYATQALRGTGFLRSITAQLTQSFTADGVMPYVGYDWWSLYPTLGQVADWGMMSQRGNVYDGIEDVTSTVTCVTPANAYSCGGELQNYGNTIMGIITANAAIDTYILGLRITPTAPVLKGLLVQ